MKKLVGRVFWGVVWAVLLWRLYPHLQTMAGIRNASGRPQFEFASLGGALVTSDSLRGRVVLVNFWATWCLPCRAEMPLLQQMAERHRDRGLVVLGLSRDRGPVEEVRRFLAERGIDYPVAVVGADAERLFGGVTGYPTSFLIDRSGQVRQQALGPLAMLSFEPAVRRLLAEP